MKSFSTLLFCCCWILQLSAQTVVCTPDTTDLDSIIVVRPEPYQEEENPDGGIQDCAVIGEPFEFVFTIKVDESYELGGTTIDVDSIVITDINGLPEGITYECSFDNCSFARDTFGCIILSGTPEANNPTQQYQLEIIGTIHGPLLTFNTTFPNPAIAPGEYNLNLVAERNDADCAPTSTDNILARQLTLTNQPNPFSGTTTIVVEALQSQTLTFTVMDLLGQRVHEQTVRLSAGVNSFEYNAQNLANGLYLYSISDGVHVVSQKMMVGK